MNNFVPSLSDAFLKDLIAEIDTDDIRGIVLGGSHARGDTIDSNIVFQESQKRRPERGWNGERLLVILSVSEGSR